jgi:phenylpyruvate tautomerase PptA (4-oxalocrotonate tautomerase family)
MKKSWISIVLVFVLGGLTYYFVSNQNSSTVKKQLTNFAVKDTASITKIFLADKQNNSVLLERVDSSNWLVNGDFKARQDMVEILLKTMHAMKVRTPVPKSMHNNVVRKLSANSVKVEIYQNGGNTPSKIYYVGGPNKDHTGSFMLLENSSVPFVMHLEGHYGFLNSRYSTDEYVWRDTYLWRFPGKELTQIKSVEVQNHSQPQKGFKVNKITDNSYEVVNSKGQVVPSNPGKVLSYLKGFEKVAFEGYEQTKSKAFIDSVMTHSPPMHTLSLTTETGEKTAIKTWKKPMTKPAEELFSGDSIKFDMERMYIQINGQQNVIGQYFVFSPLTPDIDFFEK